MAADLEVAIISIGIVIISFGSLFTIFVFNTLQIVILAGFAGLVLANLLVDSWKTKTSVNIQSSIRSPAVQA